MAPWHHVGATMEITLDKNGSLYDPAGTESWNMQIRWETNSKKAGTWQRRPFVISQQMMKRLRWVMTVLTAELTHFNLVIHLSKLQQLALRFVSHFEISCCSGCPRDPSDLLSSKAASNYQKLPFYHCSLRIWSSTWHSWQKATGMSFSCRCGLFGIWWGETYCASNSMELGSCFMPLRHDLTTVPVQGIIARLFRHLGTESCL